MDKHKICVIGGGLTGLVTAITLSRLNLKVDLIAENFFEKSKSLRTTAISDSNYKFLKKLNIFNTSNETLWSCSKVKLYDTNLNLENSEILDFDTNHTKDSILHMITNYRFESIMKKRIKKNKNICIKSNTKVLKIFSHKGYKYVKTECKNFFKYSLIIICAGKKSFLTKIFLENKCINYDYDETSIVTAIKHDRLKNDIARQFFLDEGPLALLPISNTKTSIVWSVKKNVLYKQKNREIFLKQNIKNVIKNIYKNVNFYTNTIEYKDLDLHFSYKSFDDRVLIFGESLHSVHPIVGQGFNMILRDLNKLEKTIVENKKLGLDVGSSIILSEFVNNIKSNNFVSLVGIEFIKKTFSINNIKFKKLRNYYLNALNSNSIIKSFFIKIADKGINL